MTQYSVKNGGTHGDSAVTNFETTDVPAGQTVIAVDNAGTQSGSRLGHRCRRVTPTNLGLRPFPRTGFDGPDRGARKLVDLPEGVGRPDQVAVVRLERWLRARRYHEAADRVA